MPLHCAHKSFFDMPSEDRRALVADRAEVLSRQFKGLKEFRNKAIDHREILRPDNAVLDYWAATSARLARDVLSAAIMGWYRGAKTLEALERRLRTAYHKLGAPLR